MSPRGLEMGNSCPGFKAERTSACEDVSGKETTSLSLAPALPSLVCSPPTPPQVGWCV